MGTARADTSSARIVFGSLNGLRFLLAIWIAQVSYRGLTAVIFAHLWRQGRWATIKV